MEQTDIVDIVKGTPKAAAARAALISPSGDCMPQEPTGERATGMATFSPIIVLSVERPVRSRATRWRRRILAKSETFSRKVCSV